MERTCRLCQRTAGQDACFIRMAGREHPACRTCWEQVLLDPRRVIRSLQGSAVAPAAARPPVFYPADAFRP
jgi:hypothetical protein